MVERCFFFLFFFISQLHSGGRYFGLVNHLNQPLNPARESRAHRQLWERFDVHEATFAVVPTNINSRLGFFSVYFKQLFLNKKCRKKKTKIILFFI